VTADRLARHYPSLRPDERLALMLAAARGDDVEHERLIAAAPRVSFTTLHTFPRAVAFRELLDHVRAEGLALAARYFQARSAVLMTVLKFGLRKHRLQRGSCRPMAGRRAQRLIRASGISGSGRQGGLGSPRPYSSGRDRIASA
jgi:hypothetical protein